MTDHSKGDVYGKFCAIRKKPCPDNDKHQHKNDYFKLCDPKWKGDYKFFQGKDKDGKRIRGALSYNAHHKICIADISKVLLTPGILNIVKQTKWCANAKRNMLAMPLMGHSLKHYCNLNTNTGKVKTKKLSSGEQTTTKRPPPFKNLPHHDSDHMRYQKDDVQPALKKIKNTIKKSRKKHAGKVKQLADDLDNLSDYLEDEVLKKRATRGRHGGTHDSWKAGINGETDWYLCFSMANTGNAQKRTFPSVSGDYMDKLQKLVKDLLLPLG